MWLLDAKTIQLREFADNEIPRYAILSHTWGSITEEVTFADMLEAAERASAGDEKPHIETAKKTGFFKIESSCRQALADEIDYVWVDTCCINKNSLTDLSEAINSMFRWYQGARVCYAFLADVPPKTPSEKWLRHLYAARWFQRGWTLQELLAPPDVRFYSKDWTFIGTRSKMRHTIARITGIDVAYLDGKDLRHASVAKKMSWASQRTTTRLEDTAYCLLGIFNVNMPLLYGEGNKAFLRLQEEIIKDSEDQSIFAWGSRQPWSGALRLRGLFARSPAEFAESGDIVPSPGLLSSNPYALTNRGLRIELRLGGPIADQQDKYQLAELGLRGPYVALLSCRVERSEEDGAGPKSTPGSGSGSPAPAPPTDELCILLVRMPAQQTRFARLGSSRPRPVSAYRFPIFKSLTNTVIFVKEFVLSGVNLGLRIGLRLDRASRPRYHVGGAYPPRSWSEAGGVISFPDGLYEGSQRLLALTAAHVALLFKAREHGGRSFVLVVGHVRRQIWCNVLEAPGSLHGMQSLWEGVERTDTTRVLRLDVDVELKWHPSGSGREAEGKPAIICKVRIDGVPEDVVSTGSGESVAGFDGMRASGDELRRSVTTAVMGSGDARRSGSSVNAPSKVAPVHRHTN